MTSIASDATQREKVKARVIETANKEFLSHGVKNVTMDDIAHILGMSKRTLYQLFADKEELLLASIMKHDTEEMEKLEALARKTDNVFDFILYMFARKMDDLQKVSLAFVQETMKYPKVQAYFRQKQQTREADAVCFLTRGVEQGYFRSDINFHIVYHEITNSIDLVCRSLALTEYSHVDLFRNTAIVCLRGCSTLKGIELIDKFMESYGEKHGEG